jgi:hypothetical protein
MTGEGRVKVIPSERGITIARLWPSRRVINGEVAEAIDFSTRLMSDHGTEAYTYTLISLFPYACNSLNQRYITYYEETEELVYIGIASWYMGVDIDKIIGYPL